MGQLDYCVEILLKPELLKNQLTNDDKHFLETFTGDEHYINELLKKVTAIEKQEDRERALQGLGQYVAMGLEYKEFKDSSQLNGTIKQIIENLYRLRHPHGTAVETTRVAYCDITQYVYTVQQMTYGATLHKNKDTAQQVLDSCVAWGRDYQQRVLRDFIKEALEGEGKTGTVAWVNKWVRGEKEWNTLIGDLVELRAKNPEQLSDRDLLTIIWSISPYKLTEKNANAAKQIEENIKRFDKLKQNPVIGQLGHQLGAPATQDQLIQNERKKFLGKYIEQLQKYCKGNLAQTDSKEKEVLGRLVEAYEAIEHAKQTGNKTQQAVEQCIEQFVAAFDEIPGNSPALNDIRRASDMLEDIYPSEFKKVKDNLESQAKIAYGKVTDPSKQQKLSLNVTPAPVLQQKNPHKQLDDDIARILVQIESLAKKKDFNRAAFLTWLLLSLNNISNPPQGSDKAQEVEKCIILFTDDSSNVELDGFERGLMTAVAESLKRLYVGVVEKIDQSRKQQAAAAIGNNEPIGVNMVQQPTVINVAPSGGQVQNKTAPVQYALGNQGVYFRLLKDCGMIDGVDDTKEMITKRLTDLVYRCNDLPEDKTWGDKLGAIYAPISVWVNVPGDESQQFTWVKDVINRIESEYRTCKSSRYPSMMEGEANIKVLREAGLGGLAWGDLGSETSQLMIKAKEDKVAAYIKGYDKKEALLRALQAVSGNKDTPELAKEYAAKMITRVNNNLVATQQLAAAGPSETALAKIKTRDKGAMGRAVMDVYNAIGDEGRKEALKNAIVNYMKAVAKVDPRRLKKANLLDDEVNQLKDKVENARTALKNVNPEVEAYVTAMGKHRKSGWSWIPLPDQKKDGFTSSLEGLAAALNLFRSEIVEYEGKESKAVKNIQSGVEEYASVIGGENARSVTRGLLLH